MDEKSGKIATVIMATIPREHKRRYVRGKVFSTSIRVFQMKFSAFLFIGSKR